jgi:hypothetical protein
MLQRLHHSLLAVAAESSLPTGISRPKALHVKTRARDSTTTTLCSRRKNTKEKNEPKILQRPQHNL